MATARETALSEYDPYSSDHQPVIFYFGQLQVTHLLDLEDSGIRSRLGINDGDLTEEFRMKPQPTRLELLALAISQQRRICAIRYPSNAARKQGARGTNFAIFPDALQAPDSLQIMGEAGSILEQWP